MSAVEKVIKSAKANLMSKKRTEAHKFVLEDKTKEFKRVISLPPLKNPD